MARPSVGLMLPPDQATLDRLMPLLEGPVQHFAVTPETLWRPTAAGDLAPNDYHRRFLELGARTGRPFIAHGVALSPAGAERRRATGGPGIGASPPTTPGSASAGTPNTPGPPPRRARR